jgi:hypothetical protein
MFLFAEKIFFILFCVHYCFGIIFFYDYIVGHFCHEQVFILAKCFFCTYWNNLVIFIFYCLMGCITLIDLFLLNLPLSKSCLLLLYELFIFDCVWFVTILFRIFSGMCTSLLDCSYLVLFSGFGTWTMLTSENGFGNILPMEKPFLTRFSLLQNLQHDISLAYLFLYSL